VYLQYHNKNDTKNKEVLKKSWMRSVLGFGIY